MGHAAGLRAGTRYAFSRGFKKTGYIALSTYLRNYKFVLVYHEWSREDLANGH
jgi:hypothetical protein